MSALELGFFAIPVLNVESAQSFYGPVMGWSFKERDQGFAYIFAGEKMIGSLELASKSLKPSEFGTLVYFRANGMKETLRRVLEKGGVVVEKVAMEGGARGYTAKILDPFRNCIGFWSPLD